MGNITRENTGKHEAVNSLAHSEDAPRLKLLEFRAEDFSIIDLIMILQRHWKLVALCFLSAIVVSCVVAHRVSRFSKISVPILLPSEEHLATYVLPKITLIDDGARFIPPLPVIEKSEVLESLQAHVRRIVSEDHGSFTVDFEILENKTQRNKVHALNIVLASANKPEEITTKASLLINQSLETFFEELHHEVDRKLKKRAAEIEQAKVYLTESIIRDTRNKIFARKKEIEAKRASLLNRIKAIESESQIKRENELKALEENNKTQKYEIERELKALHQLAAVRRSDRIEALKEALIIAENLGIDDVGGKMHSITNLTDDSLPYLRGKKALAAEIKQLQEQTNDSLLVPKIRELEQGLRLITSESRYLALKERNSDRHFSPDIPPLMTLLELLKNDEQLLSLQDILDNPDSIQFQNRDFQNLNSDLTYAERIKADLSNDRFISHGEPVFLRNGKKLAMIITGGALLGLMFGCALVIGIEGLKSTVASSQLRKQNGAV